MNDILNFLGKLKAKQIFVSPDDVLENLRIRGELKNLSGQDKQELKDRKAELLQFFKEQTAVVGDITPVKEQSSYPISNAQRRLWVLSQIEEASVAYNMPGKVLLHQDMNVESFRRAVLSAIERHEILRTVFRKDEKGEVRQWIVPAGTFELKIDHLDLRNEKDKQACLRSYIKTDASRVFDLGKGPLLRTALLQLDDQEYVFYFNMHHIISDGWSMKVLAKDVMAYYEAYSTNQVPALKELRIQYKDYSAWQLAQLGKESYEVQKNYWLNSLQGELPLIDLPRTKDRPEIRTHNGRTVITYLNKSVTSKLKEYALQREGTLFISIVAVLKSLLYRYTGQQDLILGTPIAGRTHLDLEEQIGFYVNALALRTRIEVGDSFEQVYQKVRHTILEAYANQMYPFDDLVEELSQSRQISRNAVFDLTVALQNAGDNVGGPQVDEMLLDKIVEQEAETCIYDIRFDFQEQGDCLRLLVEYNKDIYHPEIIEGFIHHFKHFAALVLTEPGRDIAAIDYLQEKEKQELTETFHETAYSGEETLVDLFARQVKAQKQKSALRSGSEEYSYMLLDKRANQFANFLLRETGIKQEAKIGLLLTPGPDTIAAILGVLKAGAAYVPLDPYLPEERLSFMISDLGMEVLITEKEFIESANRLQWSNTSLKHYLCIDSDHVRSESETRKNALMSQELWDHVGERAEDQITGGGWLSSYTGLPIPEKEMEEYAMNAYQKLKGSLKPAMRVLEIGCSSGLTLSRIAPEVAFYYGTDLSGVIIANTQKLIAEKGLTNVVLKQMVADEISGLEERDFDLIIINSVIQSFHGHNYLRRVIRDCVGLLKTGGRIFIGDVMDLEKKRDLVEDLERFKRENRDKGYITKTDFSSELFVARGYFEDLVIEEAAISKADISEKISTIENELTKFRYDVILHTDKNRAVTAGSLKRHKTQYERMHLDSQPENAPGIHIAPAQLAYIIYTSGTTGKPKGVMIEHQAVLNTLRSQIEVFGLAAGAKGLQFASLAFDASVSEIFIILLSGGTLYIPSEAVRKDPNLLTEFIEANKIDIATLPPSYLSKTDLSKLKGLKKLITAGEAANYEKALEYLGPGIYFNAYGPTETSICCTVFKLEDRAVLITRSLPVGTPLSNTQIYLLDEQQHLVPKGVTGEIYVGGAGLARGYLNRKELTLERFVANPFKQGGRLYRTGDLGRWLPDGNLHFVGRKDNQVKLRGYRIEPGEIEHMLLNHADIKEAVVLAKETGQEEKELVAYISSDVKQNVSSLRAYLKEFLPDYMIPAYVVQLTELPLTSNGKVDRKALPDPEGLLIASGTDYVAPATELEEKLVQIWKKVLQRETIGIADDFFALGGHSLRAVRLSNEYQKEFGIKLSLKDLFSHATIETQAELLDAATQTGFTRIEKVQVQDSYPVSDAQRRLWTLSQFEGGSVAYNVPMRMQLNEAIDINNFRKAVNAAIDRHEILRTVFKEDRTGEIRQWILDREALDFEIVYKDFREEQDKEEKIKAYISEDAFKPFNLVKGPLLRAGLLQAGDQDYVFYYNMHHIISDGWSMEVLSKDVLAYYTAYKENEAPALKALSIQYKDYSAWELAQLTGEAFKQHRAYWLENLGGELPLLDLPATKQRPKIRTSNGHGLGIYLDKETTAQLRRYAGEKGGSLFMGLLAAWNVLMYHYTSQTHIITGTSIAAREHADLEDQIGFYSNTLALKNELKPDQSFDDFFRTVKENTLKSYTHQMYPFIRLAEELELQRDTSRNAIFDIMLFLQNNGERAQTGVLTEAQVNTIADLGYIASKFDINVGVQEVGDYLSFQVVYNTDVYDKNMVSGLILHYRRLISALLKEPGERISRVNCLSAEERQQLLKDFNTSSVSYPREKSLATLFREQVARTPEATALVFKEKALSYRELDELSDKLAHLLYTHYQVKTDDLIGIQLNRGEWMIVAMLAILKSGAAYVPVDPEDPSSRKEYIIKDAALKVLITEVNFLHDIDYFEGDIFAIDVEFDTDNYAHEKLTVDTQPEDLAYVIYTSGSTGKPKGVMISTGSVVDYVAGVLHRTNMSSCASFGLVSTIAADLGNTVIYASLLTGGSLHILDKEEILHADRLQAHKLDCLKMTPSHWKALQGPQSFFAPAKCLILGGEPFPEDCIERFKSHNAQCGVYNHYGPTETTIGKLIRHMDIAQADQKISLGTPMGNNQVYILDAALQLCPLGVTGEICISGAGVARGYLNQPQLTAEKFTDDPFRAGQRLYRTGDLGRWLEDGTIEFIGRKDDQVKIRGYRIETGEIEQALLKHRQIEEAVVLARTNHNKEKELVAYFTSGAGLDTAELRAHLKTQLPEYMQPAHFVRMEAMPITTNGKLNKRLLPDPSGLSLSGAAGYVAPRNGIEERIIETIAEIVARPKDSIGVYDNFFDLGLSSLGLIKLYTLINKELNANLNAVSVFEFSNVATLTGYIFKGRPETEESVKEENISGAMDEIIDLM